MRRPVREVMTRDVAVIRQDADVHELEKLFVERGIHGVPVVDEGGRLTGVVSQTDLIAWHYELGLDGSAFYDMPQLRALDDGDDSSTQPEDEENPDDDSSSEARERLELTDIRAASVREVMTPLVHAIRPDCSAGDAAARMLRHRIHRLIVVDDDLRVLGIVCAMDLLALVPGVAEAAKRG